MNTAWKKEFVILQKYCHRFIGEQHAFFDDLVADVLGTVVGTSDMALGVQFDFNLGKMEFQSTTFQATFFQNHRKLSQVV